MILSFVLLLWCQCYGVIMMTSGSGSGSGSGSWEWSGNASGDSDAAEDVYDDQSGTVRSKIPSSSVRAGEISFEGIIKESLGLLIGELGSPVDLREMLDKYYFTGKKSMSIWPKAIEDTSKTYGLTFNERDLTDFQNDIKKIYQNMMYCDEKLSKHDKKHRVEHAECYETVYEIISEGDVDFGFPTGSLSGTARILNLNIAFNLLRLLYLELSQQLALVIGLQPMNVTKNIYTVAEDVVNKYKLVEKVALEARTQQIGNVEICSVQEILFEEFPGTCEASSKIEEDDVTVAGSTSQDPFKQKFRAKIMDKNSDEEVCNEAMSTTPQKDAEAVKSELREICKEKKATYVNKVTKEMKQHISRRSGLISEELPKLWRKKQKTLKKLKAELDSKISQS